jgi:hypothetical protein
MEMKKTKWFKRLAIGMVPILLGIILWERREHFLGGGAIMGGILSIIGLTKEDKLMWHIGGVYFLIGGILSFFFPQLFYASLYSQAATKIANTTVGIMVTIAGIYMILRGLRK